MVFQNYALYPHMTVRENMGFALRLRGVDKEEINKKVEDSARILDLEPHLDRKPSQLSGGQRQRVAMGRAIVRDPAAFLMDEPLSNLDAKLRVQMRTEVARLQQQLGTTMIYVTHDQTEAMTLGDRVAVMRSGVLQQVGSPMELYNAPLNLFVAGFIGSPAMNFMPATVKGDTVKLPFGDVRLPQEMHGRLSQGKGRQLIAGIRPEHFEDASLVGDAKDRGSTFRAKIEVVESMGSELYAHFTVSTDETIESDELRELAADAGGGEVPSAGEGRIVARLDPAAKVKQGEEAELWVDATKLQLFDPDDGRNLMVDAPARRRSAARLAASSPLLQLPTKLPDHRVVLEPWVLEVAANSVDHLVGPVVRSQDQVAQVRDLHVRLGVAHALRHELRLAQHLDDGLVLVPEPRLGGLRAR